jgi:tryptophan synthase alpha chain
MNRIDTLFADARRRGQTAFVPFLTAGDPNLETTVALAQAVLTRAERLEVPVALEIGFPYSDPIADGAVIQESYTRALAGKIRVAEIFGAVKRLRQKTAAPLLAMVSYSLVYRRRCAEFLRQAQEAGFDGAIIPDLPVEEAAEAQDYGRDHDFKIIELIAPTTPPERAGRIVETSSGFIYFISVVGITGERDRLPVDLTQRIAALRQRTRLPICVGFGIGRPEHVSLLKGAADGVIVGSAIVRRLKDLSPSDPAAIDRLADFVATLMAPLTSGNPATG